MFHYHIVFVDKILRILNATNEEFQALYTRDRECKSYNKQFIPHNGAKVNKTPQTQAHFVCI